LVKDRKIESMQMHIEKNIGLAKTFKIPKKEPPHGKAISWLKNYFSFVV
jgi:hypothetical protein